MSRPRLFIVSGPSGSGKGTLLSDLLKRHPDVFYSISATTRAPREGLEQDGVHYYFLTHEKFEQMIADDAFIEYKRYCGNIYGTPRKPVEDALKSGRSVILEIEPNIPMPLPSLSPLPPWSCWDKDFGDGRARKKKPSCAVFARPRRN